MKKYFKLESNNYVNFSIKKEPKLGEQSVMLGRMTDPTKLPPLIFEHNFPSGERIPHYLAAAAVLASKLLIDLLVSIGVNNFQAFPAQLINPETGEKRDDYFLFNVLGFMKVANLEASEYDTLMSGNPEGFDLPLLAFKNLAINGNQVRDIDMFRLAEEPITIIISDRVDNALIKFRPEGGWGIVVEEVDVV
jgi:hypothetical protein